MKLFSGLSLRQQLIAIQLLTTLSVLGLYSVFTVVNESRLQNRALTRMSETMTRMIAVNSTAALDFEDISFAQEILASAEANKDIENAWIYDTQGNLFADYSKTGGPDFDFPQLVDGIYKSEPGYLSVSSEVIRRGEVLGVVSTRTSLREQQTFILRSTALAILALTIGMIVALLLSTLLQRTITQPVNALVDTIKQVSDTGNHALRIADRRNDEIGILYTGFNEMLGKIRQREEERDTAETILRHKEKKYRELVENANSIILRWDREGKITFLNEYGQHFFGYSEHEVLGQHVMGLIVPATDSVGTDMHRLMDRICADPDGFEHNVNENIRRNGERVWVAWTNKVAFDDRGQVEGILSIGTDITERKRAEGEVRRLNQDLQRYADELEQRVTERTQELAVAKERAESADRLKSAFLATMSHELRTPLNSIIGFTGIILQELPGPLNAEQKKQLGMVQGSARHLLELINDVLDISKIEAGELVVAREPFDLAASVRKVTGIIAPLVARKGLEFSVVLPERIGTMVGDVRRVEQILLNLIGNAIKFTESGGVTIEVETLDDYKPLNATATCGAVRLTIRDTGIGIKPEDMLILFQSFRQVDTALSRNHEGTGLGLAICRRLAALMGGEVKAESEYGVGSRFTVTLPRGERVNEKEPS